VEVFLSLGLLVSGVIQGIVTLRTLRRAEAAREERSVTLRASLDAWQELPRERRHGLVAALRKGRAIPLDSEGELALALAESALSWGATWAPITYALVPTAAFAVAFAIWADQRWLEVSIGACLAFAAVTWLRAARRRRRLRRGIRFSRATGAT